MIELFQQPQINVTNARRVCTMSDEEEMLRAKKLERERTVKLKTRIRKNMNLIYTYESRIQARNERIKALLDEVAQIKAKRELAKMEISEDEGKLAA